MKRQCSRERIETELMCWARAACLGLSALACACSGSTAGTSGANDPTDPTEADDFEGTTVYDAKGKPVSCQAPARDCPPIAPNRAFLDACQLGGFRTVRCGCDTLCTGKVETRVYDKAGQPVTCPEQEPPCDLPQVSAKFQDACIERGHHISACGCQWVCSGDPTK